MCLQHRTTVQEPGCGLRYALACTTGAPCSGNLTPQNGFSVHDGKNDLMCMPPNPGIAHFDGGNIPAPVPPAPVPVPPPVPTATPVPSPQQPVCGQFLPDTALIAPLYKDIPVVSPTECVQLCRNDPACVAVSYKRSGACWLRTQFSDVQPDAGKKTFILCGGKADGGNSGAVSTSQSPALFY